MSQIQLTAELHVLMHDSGRERFLTTRLNLFFSLPVRARARARVCVCVGVRTKEKAREENMYKQSTEINCSFPNRIALYKASLLQESICLYIWKNNTHHVKTGELKRTTSSELSLVSFWSTDYSDSFSPPITGKHGLF